MRLFDADRTQTGVLTLVTLLLFACRHVKASACSCKQFGGCRTDGQCKLNEDQTYICNNALGKNARVSSVFKRQSRYLNEISGPACLAVNGNNGTDFRPINQHPQDPKCGHTADNNMRPYWLVDLGDNYNIVNIVVYGRKKDNARHLRYATVTVDNNWCYNFSSKPEIPTVISCNTPLAGRLVKISKTKHIWGEYFLTLCEVLVWVCQRDSCGPKCSPCNQIPENQQSTTPRAKNINQLTDRTETSVGNQDIQQVPTTTSNNRSSEVLEETNDRTVLVASLVVIFILAIMLSVIAVFIIRKKHQLPRSTNTGNMAAKRRRRTRSSDGNTLATVNGSSNAAVSAESQEPVRPEQRAVSVMLDIPDTDSESDNLYYNEEAIYATFKASRPELDKVQRHLVDMMASGHLFDQFENLPKDLNDDHEAAILPFNLKKNRYPIVLPYDKNRVVLKDGYTQNGATDFINASYITGFRRGKVYIAAQAPRETTISDLWRMVWQEHITQIIMLTKVAEYGKDKCAVYWPDLGKYEAYGPVAVTCTNVQRRANFLVRSFIIKMHGSSEERRVEQYHYQAWPDHGVPSTICLLNFWRFVTARGSQTPAVPVLVHCTAGVGRTGTYIGLDIAYEKAVTDRQVNIFDIVKRLRGERCFLVHKYEQFVFLHKVVLEAYTARETLISLDQFDKRFPQLVSAPKANLYIDAEFQTVMQMRSLAPELSTEISKQEDNLTKNRNKDTLPADEHLVFLTDYVPGKNQFINAVYISTYLNHKGAVLTQMPLQQTVVDFWRLVEGCDITTIVSLSSKNEDKIVKDYCLYWPKETGTSLNADPYIIIHQSTSALASSLVKYKMEMQKKQSSSREVQLFHYQDWTDELPGDSAALLVLLEELEKIRQSDKQFKPVVFQCLDGVGKSGLVYVLNDVTGRLKNEQVVDVYLTVRKVHSVRPQAVTTLTQYRYCYEMAQRLVQEFNKYKNC